MRRVGWVVGYRIGGRQVRVSPAVNVTGFVLPAARRRRGSNRFAGIRRRRRQR